MIMINFLSYFLLLSPICIINGYRSRHLGTSLCQLRGDKNEIHCHMSDNAVSSSMGYISMLMGKKRVSRAANSLNYHPGVTSKRSLSPTRRLDTKLHAATIQLEENGTKQYDKANGAWLPVASVSGLDQTLPNQIEIVGEKYVVWKSPESQTSDKNDDPSTWNIMKDICSHRFAPLSQGRIDKSTGCIECPYHGWQFDHVGQCTRIPQLEPAKSIPKAASVISYPVKLLGDILFAFLPIDDGISYYPTIPEEMSAMISNISSFFVRELPYSFDFVLENFMDPAHIPYAHHTLQSTRDDGRPIPMKLVTAMEDKNMIEVSFEDTSRGIYRDGILSFEAPCYYHFRVFMNSKRKRTKSKFSIILLLSYR